MKSDKKMTVWAYRMAVIAGAVVYGYLLYVNMWISDDGYIYLDYVKNYVEYGEAAFNLGEKVDAATGFLWFLLLSLFQKLFFFLDARQNAFLLSFALSAASYGWIAREIFRGHYVWIVAIPFLFLTWVGVSFSTSGLETPLIVFALIWLFVRIHRQGFLGKGNAVIIALLPFIRPELGILLLLYVPAAVVKRRYDVLLAAVATLLVLAVWRYLLFGDILPNTAFVKLFSQTHGSGAWYFKEFFYSYMHYAVLAAVFILLFLVQLFRRRLTPESLFWGMSALLLGGYIYVSGGDFMHGRFFIPVIVIVVLWMVAFFERKEPVGMRESMAILLLAFLIGMYAVVQRPYCLQGERNWYHGIMDEQSGYEADNDRLHAWRDVNHWKWLAWTRRMNEMACRYQIPVGAVYPAIGQVRYYSDPELFYVFDKLSLTRVVGSFIQTGGHFTRIGHLAEMPDPLVYREKRVTLYHTPSKALDRLLRFSYGGSDAVLIALSQIDRYVEAGLLLPDTWEQIDGLVGRELASGKISTPFLFYLAWRYPEERKYYGEIKRLYEERKNDKGWISWYEENRPIIETAERIQKGEINALPARYLIYWKYGSFKPISSCSPMGVGR